MPIPSRTTDRAAAEAPLRVVVADDHRGMREALGLLLAAEGDMTIVAEASDADQTAVIVAEHEPDALVLDLSMPGPGGLATLRSLRARWPRMPIIVVSMHEAVDFEGPVLDAGADAFVPKEQAEELHDRVTRVARNGSARGRS